MSESPPERLAAIRARLDAHREHHDIRLIAYAATDISWLLEEVERLSGYAQHDELCDLARGVAAPVCCTCGLNDERYGIRDE